MRITDSRLDILDVFLTNRQALSEQFIERELNGKCDRVTIYRTLKTYMDKGLLHRVLDEDSAVKFALCPDECDDHGHQHEHAHFKCQMCGNTTCLEHAAIQDVPLPKGYKKLESNLLVLGLCDKCS